MTLRPLAFAVSLSLATVLAACSPSAPQAGDTVAQAPQADKAAQLNQLYADYWEGVLKLNPLQATFQGDNRYNDQLPDTGSAEFRKQLHDFTVQWLGKVEKIGDAGLSGQDLLSYRIFVEEQKQSLEGEKFPGWMMPVNQMGSTVSYAVMLGSGQVAQPFKTVKDYDNWLARAGRIPVLLDTEIGNMREGMKAGVVQPRVLMEKVVPQFDALITAKAEDSQFWGPIKQMPADFTAADKERLTAAYRALIEGQLMPAIKKQRDFIANEYLPATRDAVGLDALPDGKAWYAFNAKESTTTAQTPEQIHEIGVKEVARIHGEMHKVMEQVGFKGSLQDFFKFMQHDKQFEFASEQALLEHYDIEPWQIIFELTENHSLTNPEQARKTLAQLQELLWEQQSEVLGGQLLEEL